MFTTTYSLLNIKRIHFKITILLDNDVLMLALFLLAVIVQYTRGMPNFPSISMLFMFSRNYIDYVPFFIYHTCSVYFWTFCTNVMYLPFIHIISKGVFFFTLYNFFWASNGTGFISNHDRIYCLQAMT
jgi:hypothetical protein